MDPRVKTSPLGLSQQFTLSKQLYDGILDVQKALEELRAVRQRLSELPAGPSTPRDLGARFAALEGQGGGGRGAAPAGPPTLTGIAAELNQLMGLLQGADVTPTTQLVAAVGGRRADLAKLLARWAALKAEARTIGL